MKKFAAFFDPFVKDSNQIFTFYKIAKQIICKQHTKGITNLFNLVIEVTRWVATLLGSRAIAMGGAFTAVANDATALYWNPAGLSQCKRPELTLNHIDWFLDIYHEYVGAVLPLGRHCLGASITYVGFPDQKVRTIDEPENNGVPDDGEPNFDRTDLDESDQIGLTSFTVAQVNQYKLKDDQVYISGLNRVHIKE